MAPYTVDAIRDIITPIAKAHGVAFVWRWKTRSRCR